MSSAADLMRNELLTEVQDQTQHEREAEDEVMGKMWHLRPSYFNRFRFNEEHGVLGEMLIPIFFHAVVAVYTYEWYFAQNLLVAYIVIFFAYFQFVTLFPPAGHVWAWCYAAVIHLS